jgi:hypothetical protein
MRALQYVGVFMIVVGFIACSGNHNTANEEAETGNELSQENCVYTYTEGSLNVKWTAFKTTEKVGVSGSFDTISVNGIQKSNSATEMFANADFSIPVSSINSSNPDRDKKILEHFFGTMVETSTLNGKVLGMKDSDCSVLINMNGVADTCVFNLSKNDTAVSLVGVIELANWNALQSADALNTVCFDLHKGADGVSKLWPDVKLEITAGITKKCD